MKKKKTRKKIKEKKREKKERERKTKRLIAIRERRQTVLKPGIEISVIRGAAELPVGHAIGNPDSRSR